MTAESSAVRPRLRPSPIRRLSANQVNLLLEALVVAAMVSGVTSWAVGTGWSRLWTLLHGLCGLAILLLAPVKVRRSVRPGLRRRQPSRWLSLAFGLLVLVTVAMGLLHATGLWFGVGYWSALWVHFLAAFSLIPLFLWHIVSRPVRPQTTDLNRRLVVGGSVLGVASAALYGSLELAVRVADLAGGRRRFTGSHEIASFDPERMPTVVWIDDRRPQGSLDDWSLTVAGASVSIEELWDLARPLDAVIDCTGGWWSEQRWDVVSLAELGDWTGPSIKVESVTGYARWLPAGDAADLYLAVGYGGRPLGRGHGAPVRLVAPGRRGPWWVKWVTSVEPSGRQWWQQLPFPPT